MDKKVASEGTKTAVPLQVVLENPSKVFFSGEMITGVLKFQIEPDHKVQILSVNLNAEYYRTKNDQELVEVIYTDTCSVDVKSAGEGTTDIPFSLVVRPGSPTSLACSLGGIRYRVVSTLLYKGSNRVQCVEAAEFVSVNSQKKLVGEIVGQRLSALEGCNWCCFGRICADFEVACVSLLCGHNAIINACIKNDTGSYIQGTSVSLVQKIVRLLDQKVVKSTVATKERGAILPGKRQVWLSDRFLIPPLPPTSVDPYFKVRYSFILVLQKTSSKGIRLKIPIVIGNLPRENDGLAMSTQYSLGSEMSSLAEGRCSHLSRDVNGFKPLYVTYIS